MTKDAKPNREPESHPSRSRAERPDNGCKGSRGTGPSSGLRRDNPHKALKLVRHAWNA
jgi:hypothetical protein